GGFVIYTIGGNFDASYSDGSSSANALNGKNSSVTSFINSTMSTLTGSLQTNDASSPSFNPASAVDNTAHTINLGQDLGYKTGDAVVYSAGSGDSPINGLQDGQTYFVIVNPNDPTKVQLAASFEDAQAGKEILITNAGTTGTQHQLLAGNAAFANSARSTTA